MPNAHCPRLGDIHTSTSGDLPHSRICKSFIIREFYHLADYAKPLAWNHFGKIADLHMTTLPRAMKSSALLTKGGDIDQYLSALASWYVNIRHRWKLLKEYPTFLTQNCCWGVRLVLRHDSGSNWNWPSVNTGKCRVIFQELKSPVPEFHSRLRKSPRVP